MTRVSARLKLEECARDSGNKTLVPIELVCRADPKVIAGRSPLIVFVSILYLFIML